MSCGAKDLREGLGGKAGRETDERKPRGRRSRLRDLAAGRILQTRRILEGEKTYQV